MSDIIITSEQLHYISHLFDENKNGSKFDAYAFNLHAYDFRNTTDCISFLWKLENFLGYKHCNGDTLSKVENELFDLLLKEYSSQTHYSNELINNFMTALVN